jgi:AcrR family transcriptional regulator
MASVDRTRAGRPRTEGIDEALLEAALVELGRVGYARMSLEKVARLAGTTKPTLYLRYPSKVALVSAALGSLRKRTPRELTGEVRGDLVAELRLLHAGAIERRGISMLGAALAEEHENPEITALYREHVVRPRRENLRRIMEAGKESGQLRADADTELGITMLVGSLYALHAAGEPVPRDWPERVVAGWLEANVAGRVSPARG